MKQLSKLLLVCLVSAISFYSCTEKEVEVPTEDTERTDRLRNELESLMTRLYGLESEALDAELDKLNAEIQQANLNGDIDRVMEDIEERIEDITLSLNRTVEYAVTIVDLQSNPIAGATVQLAQGDELVSQATDENGVAIFDGLSGEYIAVNVNAENYATLSYRASLDYSSEDTTYESSTMPLINISGGPTYELRIDLFADYSDLDDTLGNTSPSSEILNQANFSGSDYERLDEVTDAKVHARLSNTELSISGVSGSPNHYDIVHSDVFWDPEIDGNSYIFHLPVESIWGQSFSYAIYTDQIKSTKTLLVSGGTPSAGENPPTWDREMFYRLTPISTSSEDIEGQTEFLGSYLLSEYYN